MSKTMKYLGVGFKLMLILLLGSLIIGIPYLIILSLKLSANTTLVIYLIFVIISLIIDGWLVIKYKRWIFR